MPSNNKIAAVGVATVLAATIAGASLTEDADADNTALGFDVRCEGQTWSGKRDPIVAKGQPSGHKHQGECVVVTRDTTRATLRAGETVANVLDDKSAAWTPQATDRNGVEVGVASINFYYRVATGVDPQDIVAPSPTMAFVAGDHTVNGPQKGPDGQKLVQWSCGGGRSGPGPRLDLPYECDPESDRPRVRVNITFPDCGLRGAKAEDYRTAMVYSDSAGACPAGYDNIPRLGMQIIYSTHRGEGLTLSNNTGMVMGEDGTMTQGPRSAYGMHADWMNGWKTSTMQFLIDRCIKDGTGCVGGNRTVNELEAGGIQGGDS